MTGEILQIVLRLNVGAAAAIVLVLMLRRPVRGRFGALAAYALWLAIPLCAAVSLLPLSMKGTPLASAVALTQAAVVQAAMRDAAPATWAAPDAARVLTMVWLAGAVALAAVFAIRQMRFVRSLGRLTPMVNPEVLQGEHLGAGPVVLGAMRPRIVVPADFKARFDDQARRLILAHERVHLARGDAMVNALVTLTRCLAWFNPLVHLGAARLRADQEIACDAVVVGRHPEKRRAYAAALLDTLLIARTVPFGCHWPPSATSAVKERLVMLNAASAASLRWATGVGLAGLIGLACAGAVWAATPGPRLIGQPVWVERPTSDDVANLLKGRSQGQSAMPIPARVVMECRIAYSGRLQKCAVLVDQPAGAGFGDLALELSRLFRMKAESRDGMATAGGRVRIPVSFWVKPL